MTKEIRLTQGKVAIVDDEDFERLNQFKWQFSKGYAVRIVLMHREICETPKGMHTDHINCDGLDNRRANLRACTASQNKGNTKAQTNNRSGYKGVSWNKRTHRWRAGIVKMRRKINLGDFDDPIDAAHAYDAAAREYFGEFARSNFADAP